MGLSVWLTMHLTDDEYHQALYGRGGEINMLSKIKQQEEETSQDLHGDLEDAQVAFDAAVESIQVRADERRAVVRHRLAALEAEDKDLDGLQAALSPSS